MRVKKSADYYIDGNGGVVFTREFLLKRGFCCKNDCRNCPYEKKVSQVKEVSNVSKG